MVVRRPKRGVSMVDHAPPKLDGALVPFASVEHDALRKAAARCLDRRSCRRAGRRPQPSEHPPSEPEERRPIEAAETQQVCQQS